MLIQSKDRMEAAQAVIYWWLKDKQRYCNNCNADFDEKATQACCENPQVGSNTDHCYGLIRQNKEMKKTRANDFASDGKDTMRWGVSLPPRLYHTLNNYFRGLGEAGGLFRDKSDMHRFMKKFPQFCIPEKV